MPGCAAVGCNNRSEKGYTMKCFPHDKKLRQIWTNKVSRADWEPSKNSFLCHVHFEADQWTLTQSGRIKLKRNAIPSIFTVTTKRKSPKKPKKLENGEDEDIYIIEYLDDPKDRNSQRSVENTLAIHREPQKVISRIGRPAYRRSNCRTASKIVMRDREPLDTIVTSDDNRRTNTRMKRKNGVMLDSDHDQKSTEAMNSSSSKVKTEMASKNDLDSDVTIEKNLESGELEANEKLMEKEENDTKNDKKNGKIACKKSGVDDTRSPKHSSAKENGKSMKNEESSNIGDAINRKRRSRYEIMKDAENSVVNSKSTTNGAIDTKPNVEKICKDIDTIRRSTFTIKLTGNEDDVTEIVEVLGTEPILKYKSSDELANSNKNVITSIISVTNHSSPIMKNEDLTLKSEIPDSSSNEMRNDKATAINGKRQENVDLTKISIESPDDDENLTIGDKLKKKIKFQEQLIRKLTDQLTNSKELASTGHINTRSQSKRRKMAPDFCNDDSRDDSKNILLKDLMAKLSKSDETTKRLNTSLIEQEEQTKKLQLQLRQRDNRIKELNWKLNKASKCLERAEKNANTYKRKMGSMQIMITRKKIREERDKIRGENESAAAVNEDAKRPVITMKNIERPVITDKIIGRPIITTNNVERPVITARNIEKPIITSKNTERPIITVKTIERPVITAKNSERSNVQARAPTTSTHANQKRSCELQNQNTEEDSVVYRTVQDIFNESSNCDDDDLSFIDNPEDFMREFAGSL